jgi:hypothetical protein
MDKEIISIVTSVIVAIIGAIKKETISNLVSKIVKGKASVKVLYIIIVLVAIAVPLTWGFGPKILSSSDTTQTSSKGNNINTEELLRETVETTKVIRDGIKDKNSFKDSVFKANLKPRWVFQIGDMTDNKKSAEKNFLSLSNNNEVSLFQVDRDEIFLFVDKNEDKETLLQSKDSLEQYYGGSLKVIDLSKYLSRKKPLIKHTSEITFGKRKNKVEVKVFGVD